LVLPGQEFVEPSSGTDVSVPPPPSVGVTVPPSTSVGEPLVTEQPAKAMLPAPSAVRANNETAVHLVLNDMRVLQLGDRSPGQVHNPHADLQLVSVQLESSSALVFPDGCDFPHASAQVASTQP
jgi:hypothetical protein